MERGVKILYYRMCNFKQNKFISAFNSETKIIVNYDYIGRYRIYKNHSVFYINNNKIRFVTNLDNYKKEINE